MKYQMQLMNAPNPEEQPILHTPWEEPSSHYQVNPQALLNPPVYVETRRPSQPSLAEIGGKDTERNVSASDEPYATINEIREHVKTWRKNGFKGTPAQKLLSRWDEEATDIHGSTRAYFCQREAVETLMWLLRTYPDRDQVNILRRLDEINNTWNDGLNRFAVKMATGAGKTRAMTMLIGCLERLHPEGCVIVIINPNLTVDDRLQSIYDDVRNSEIVPQRDRTITHARIFIRNFHKFRQNEQLFSGLGSPPSKFERDVLGARVRLESPEAMLDRVLDSDSAELPLYVFQDEGHHCRRRAEQAIKGEFKADEMDQEGQWYSALLTLKRSRDLRAVIDFSATPAYLKRPDGLASGVFPWCVSDFGIEDAIESGICKIPRLPKGSEEAEDEPKNSGIDNLYRLCIDERKQTVKWGAEPPQEVKDLMRALAEDWEVNRFEEYKKVNRVPAVIVVVNSVHNAIVLYKWISGANVDGNWVPGQIEQFSNIHPTTHKPLMPEYLPTVMAHSRITDGGEDLNKQAQDIIKGQMALWAPDMSVTEASNKIRQVFSTVGVVGELGERVRCVISVSMLSEGWDAKTVTHVFGFRRFNSVLLIEQVVGRALRRISLDDPSASEYAEIFGVPYPGLRHRDGGTTPCPPPTPRDVKSLDEQSEHRLEWPNIAQIEITLPEGRRYRLLPERVEPFKPEMPEELRIRLRNPVGFGEEKEIHIAKTRQGKVLYQLASSLTNLWLQSKDDQKSGAFSAIEQRRGHLFVDAKRAIEDWLKHEAIQIVRLDVLAEVGWEQFVIEEVAKCCVSEQGEGTGLRPRFDHRLDRTTSTDNVSFTTTLKEFVEPLKKSHLSAAACHSTWESYVARQLDVHPRIKSWVRNFRLDWRIPWWDVRMGTWREYEPDFFAVLTDDELHHVVIEVKGEEDPASLLKKEAAERWCAVLTASDDPVLAGHWSYLYITDPQNVNMQIDSLARSLV